MFYRETMGEWVPHRCVQLRERLRCQGLRCAHKASHVLALGGECRKQKLERLNPEMLRLYLWRVCLITHWNGYGK